MTPRRPEVLAPAGDRAALEAAVRAGADAVYFGLRGGHLRLVPHVQGHGRRAQLDRDRRGIGVGDGDVEAVVGEAARRPRPDARAGARDECPHEK